jgi:hypothetical protein
LEKTATVSFGEDADNLRVDAVTQRLYVGFGTALGAFDLTTSTRLPDTSLEGHPEAFALDVGQRIFANVPAASQVFVIDRDAHTVEGFWKAPAHCGNFPMTLDETSSLLFVGCRTPPQIIVIDAHSGATVAALDCVADIDDLFWNADDHRLYATGGEGFIDVFAREENTFRRTQRITTRAGARTSLLLPKSRALYVAVPSLGGQPAEIREYRLR